MVTARFRKNYQKVDSSGGGTPARLRISRHTVSWNSSSSCLPRVSRHRRRISELADMQYLEAGRHRIAREGMGKIGRGYNRHGVAVNASDPYRSTRVSLVSVLKPGKDLVLSDHRASHCNMPLTTKKAHLNAALRNCITGTLLLSQRKRRAG